MLRVLGLPVQDAGDHVVHGREGYGRPPGAPDGARRELESRAERAPRASRPGAEKAGSERVARAGRVDRVGVLGRRMERPRAVVHVAPAAPRLITISRTPCRRRGPPSRPRWRTAGPPRPAQRAKVRRLRAAARPTRRRARSASALHARARARPAPPGGCARAAACSPTRTGRCPAANRSSGRSPSASPSFAPASGSIVRSRVRADEDDADARALARGPRDAQVDAVEPRERDVRQRVVTDAPDQRNAGARRARATRRRCRRRRRRAAASAPACRCRAPAARRAPPRRRPSRRR